jgi:integrase
VHEAHRPSWRNEKHAAQFISTLETYVFPTFGNVKVSDVTSDHVLSALLPIWLSKPETARRVRQRIGAVLKWAIAKGWRTDDPTHTVAQALPKQDRRKVERRKALPYADVAGCLAAVRASGAYDTTKAAIEFLVLTAARSGEVRMATWSEINLDTAEWTIPAARMKAGRQHRVPLSPQAVDLLRRLSTRIDGSDLVFPSPRGKALSDMTFSKLIKELGVPVDVHGFRTSFRTWVQEQTDYPREVAEIALAHVVGNAVEEAYARSDLFEKRRAVTAGWAAFLAKDQTLKVRA